MANEDSPGDPLNPLRFRLIVGQEAIDEGLRQNGMQPTESLRAAVVSKLKQNAYATVEQAIREVKLELERHN